MTFFGVLRTNKTTAKWFYLLLDSSNYKFSMKANLRFSRFFVLFAAVAMTTLSSCNRGVGCPTNFSLNDFFGDVVSVAINLL